MGKRAWEKAKDPPARTALIRTVLQDAQSVRETVKWNVKTIHIAASNTIGNL